MKLDGRWLALTFCALILSCSEGTKVSGTATDTENTIAGVVLLSDSSLASGALVRQVAVSSLDYLETVTDSAGAFTFDSTLADTVNFEFRYGSESGQIEAQIVRSVPVKNAHALDVRLEEAAILRGWLDSAGDTANLAGAHFRVLLDSTTFSVDLYAPDSFEIWVPSGNYHLTIVPADSGSIGKLQDAGYADTSIVRRMDVSMKPGEKLDVGNLRWDPSHKEPLHSKMLRGTVVDENGKPIQGASVRVIADIYGTENFEKGGFGKEIFTDADGIWQSALPAMESLIDSFRVEARDTDSLGNVLAGVSAYIQKSDVENSADTFDVGSFTLRQTASFRGKIFLIDSSDSVQDTLCDVGGIRVGFLGTKHFETVSSCSEVFLQELPSGDQDLIFYSTDDLDFRNLKSGEPLPEGSIQRVHVTLTAGDTLEYQGALHGSQGVQGDPPGDEIR